MRKCGKCGEWVKYTDYAIHEKHCQSLSMADIDSGPYETQVITMIGFKCEICGANQEQKQLQNFAFPVCNECKKAIKKLIHENNHNHHSKSTINHSH